MTGKPRCWSSLHGLATLTLIGAALYFLFVEHGAHLLPYFPFLIILLCPLMHIFMHKGRGRLGHEEHNHQDAEAAYRRGLEDGRKEDRKEGDRQ